MVTTKQILAIGMFSGVIAALLPSVPTIMVYKEDTTEVTIPFTNIKTEYRIFLRAWLTLCAIGILIMVYYCMDMK